jgi:hypothetical protein
VVVAYEYLAGTLVDISPEVGIWPAIAEFWISWYVFRFLDSRS